MDNFEGVVVQYLRADRALFLNTQCCIQLNEGANPDTSGPHWYCDALAVDFRHRRVFLCEISYAASLSALLKRLTEWHANWPALCAALVRDSHVPRDWLVQPWLFVPDNLRKKLEEKLALLGSTVDSSVTMPAPRITLLEDVVPWKFRSWDRAVEVP